MLDSKNNVIYFKIEAIVRDYLYNISTLGNHDYFRSQKKATGRADYLKNNGFHILSSECHNDYVVKEEAFLEGCTRVFLINPVLKLLLDSKNIPNDWKYGDTFANYTITNREYELGNYLECIAVLDGEKVGIRYTMSAYSNTELYAMDRDFQYLYRSKDIPGFGKLKSIDKLLVLSWSAISDEELSQITRGMPGVNNPSSVMTVEQFFIQYLAGISFDDVVETLSIAIGKARRIIALNAIPQLLPNNMVNFKWAILDVFSEENVDAFEYEFEDGTHSHISSPVDVKIINKAFFDDNLREAIIGKADFAKSFITSEYLFGSISEGLSIDYTSVVVGYLKSIEQLLYLLYVSAFEGKAGLIYWDRCKKDQYFDANQTDKYRFDPYNRDKRWMQEKYYHRKKTGDNSPDIGELTRFFRYFTKMCTISEDGKEFVFKCLEDFRSHDRNSHFHKDNIDPDQYNSVKRIRNNTCVCLYYLLGGFVPLDASVSINDQFGIIDYRFERLYQEIVQKRRRVFNVKFVEGDECVIYYLNDDTDCIFEATGVLKNAELRFLKTGLNTETASLSEIQMLLENVDFVKENTISITRENMPLQFSSFLPKRKEANQKI